MKIIDGKSLAYSLDQQITQRIKSLQEKGIFPKLDVILVGNHPPSVLYVQKKKEACEKLGILTTIHEISKMGWEVSLAKVIGNLNKDPNVHGILIQIPLPKNASPFLSMVSPQKDVDGLNPFNFGRLFIGDPLLVPCTPLACLSLIHQATDSLMGANVVIVGGSVLVGRPLFLLLFHKGATVTLAHAQTKNLNKVCQSAEILVSATGVPGLITKDYLKPNTIVIDVGIYKDSNGKVWGDVDFDSVSNVEGFLTPVPGGVGPMTVHYIASNLVKICESLVVDTQA